MIETKMQVNLSRIQGAYGNDYFELRIEDEPSSKLILSVNLDDKQFAHMLSSRVANGLGKYFESDATVGKKLVVDHIEFEVVGHSDYSPKEEAIEQVDQHVPSGWVADKYFGSQNSFRQEGGKTFARATIRTWVDSESLTGPGQDECR